MLTTTTEHWTRQGNFMGGRDGGEDGQCRPLQGEGKVMKIRKRKDRAREKGEDRRQQHQRG